MEAGNSSSETATLYKELTATTLPLDYLYLDPNNPRFVSMEWDEISEDNYDQNGIQEKTRQKLERDFSVDKLVLNIETNGFLCIDRVIVKEFKPNKYVVLEGNRRICAAKILIGRASENSNSVSEDVLDSLKEIQCLIYTGSDPQPAWVFQGLRHIMGIYDWSAFNKAKLLVRIMEDENLSLTDVGKKFGLSGFGAGQWVRGYNAYKQAVEESDYTREVDEKAYPYFQEIFNRSNTPIREWLKWNDAIYKFEDELNFNEFLSWLYPRDEDEEVPDGTDILGDWSRRRLQKRDDIRSISYLLKSAPNEFTAFRTDGDLEKAYSIATSKTYMSQTDPVEEAFDNISTCIKSMQNLPFKILSDAPDKNRLLLQIEQLETAIGDIKAACGQAN